MKITIEMGGIPLDKFKDFIPKESHLEKLAEIPQMIKGEYVTRSIIVKKGQNKTLGYELWDYEGWKHGGAIANKYISVKDLENKY